MNLRSFVTILLSVGLVVSCDYYDSRLKIKNNSNHAIAFDYSSDTIPEREGANVEPVTNHRISQGEVVAQTMPGSVNGWPFQIKRSKNNKLNVFIFEPDTLLKYRDWGYIKTHRLYKRYEFTEEELVGANWIIEYP